MRAFVVAFVLFLSCTVGCSESHGITADAGRPDSADEGDVGARRDVGVCGELGPLRCLSESAHVCGDTFIPPVCSGDVWVCPAGTRADAECWCYGNEVHAPDCTCESTGWECPPSECPADPAAAEGTPCATEGQSCGACTDPCGWCNILSCMGHRWTRLEAPPPPPGTCERFDCGPDLLCVRHEQYCDHVLSDTGEPDLYRCGEYLPDCVHDCSCFAWATTACTDDGEGAVELTSGGG